MMITMRTSCFIIAYYATKATFIWVNELDRITTGDRVLIHQDDVLTEFQQRFVTTELSSYRHVKELKVTGKRPGS